jgi:class 3 adenylate cyclase/predicted ATPase
MDEMRQVTSLFADVVGSTALGEKLGPDEVKALIGECVTRMARAVEEFGGTVQAYMGDGICAYFGVPTAHGDDPERAARAGLRILQVVGEYARDIEEAWNISEFSVRVGINSGQTAVGPVGGSDPQAVALGDPTNVAARLQSRAEPGTIAVGEATARQLSDRFELEPLGDLEVKGREGTVAAWRVVRSRKKAPPPRPPVLVDRAAELAALDSVMRELASGRGQALFLIGDEGMGKTRLLLELRSSAPSEVEWLQGSCVSYGAQASYLPIIGLLREWLGVGENDADLAVRTKLRARLETLLGPTAEEVLPYLARLLSVQLDPSAESRMAALPATELSQRMRDSFAGWLSALAADHPVVVAIDDLHWVDTSTCDLLTRVLELTETIPLLLVASMHVDPATSGWRLRVRALGDYPHRSSEVTLGRLPDEAAGELLDALVPAGTLDPSSRAEIVSRAEGNPLYVEELMRALVEAGGRTRTWTLSAGSLPPTIEGLLAARFDRLPESARRLARIAAVIGRYFSLSLLERVASKEAVGEGLGDLLRADIVREARRFPELEYTFRHVLLHEAALATLTPSATRRLYRDVGAATEELVADSLDEHLEKLAFYFYRSDDERKALDYLERAADKAVSLDAREQARDLLARGLKVADRLGDDEAKTRLSRHLSLVS